MKNKATQILLPALAIFAIIFCYFLKWKTDCIHDDDLLIYRHYSEAHGFWGKLNASNAVGIFRPMYAFCLFILMETLHKNFFLFYLFNVLIQTLNTLLLARIVNLFLKSTYLSVFIALILGLSRYCYYNMMQVYGGGALEGLATTFFLLFLFSCLKAMTGEKSAGQMRRQLLLSILFANLAMYTHERYAVLFPFLILVVVFFPSVKCLGTRQRVSLAFLALFSIALPLLIKKYVLSMQLFMGTGYTTITFSASSILSLLFGSIASLLQINTGPEYIIGVPYTSLGAIDKFLVEVLAAGILIISVRYFFYLWNVIKVRVIATYRIKESKDRRAFAIKTSIFTNRALTYVFLFILLFVLLAPLVIQIRVELRWLQACLTVVVLIVVIAISRSGVRNNQFKYPMLIVFASIFIWSNHVYTSKGAKNLYFSTSARIGATFDEAIKKGIIHRNNTKLYIWEKRRSPEREGEIRWALVDGYFFSLYQDGTTQIEFVDSLFQKHDSTFSYSFPNFKKDSQQIVFLNIMNDDQTFKYSITDITNEYLKDSLRTLKTL